MPTNKGDAIVALEKNLQSFRAIRQYDSNGETESSRIANGLYDIVSTAKDIEGMIQDLTTVREEAELLELMAEVAEHIRHIVYHIGDMHFFGYPAPLE